LAGVAKDYRSSFPAYIPAAQYLGELEVDVGWRLVAHSSHSPSAASGKAIFPNKSWKTSQTHRRILQHFYSLNPIIYSCFVPPHTIFHPNFRLFPASLYHSGRMAG
jgi:hypothetical protein